MGRRPLGQKLRPWCNERVYKYQHTVIKKVCIECNVQFEAIRRLKPICSDKCKDQRRARLRPQTFINCKKCSIKFGPVEHLKVKYCSKSCAYSDRKRTKKWVPTPEARRATGLLKYYVDKGKIIRPKTCEECGTSSKRIEGAHFNYTEKLRVRWLCKSCHIKWDNELPKNGAYPVPI